MAERQQLDYVDPVGVDRLEKANQAGQFDHGSKALLDAERTAVEARRQRYKLPELTEQNTFGLALSGGGIRSATFSLGVLQALAARDLLKHVDYMSTVSGGGYIGSSLQWWWSGRSPRKFGVRPDRRGIPVDERFPYGTDNPTEWRDRAGRSPRPKLFRNLKEKGNYLTPGRGINLLSLSAVVLRTMILSLFFWVPLLTFILAFLYSTTLIDYAGLAAIFTLLLFVAVALLYSLVTGLLGFFGLAYRAWIYRARRWTERHSGWMLGATLLFAFVASINAVHCNLTGGTSCISLAPWSSTETGHATTTAGIGSGGEEAAGGQLISGWLAALGGLAGGLFTYFRTMRGVVTRLQNAPGVTTNIVAVLSAGLIIFGVLLFSHGLAVLIVDQLHFWGIVLPLIVVLVIGGCVNINHISAHRMYRDRLMEAYMPGFADAWRGKSQAAPQKADAMKMNEVDPAKGPFPIINTNLVLVGSKERRRSIRGGDSFILTPVYCGSNATGWMQCDDFIGGRMTLPTAMAISGAAANPNTGAGGVGLTRNRLISALMAFLGLRLGYWIPSLQPGRLPLPTHVWPGISAVLPYGHSEDDRFLELTDGGHFENLGIYELVRRRVRLIIVCDGAQDVDFAFEDLQRVQRRIEADFGARLELKPEALERLIPKRTPHRFPEADLKLAEAGHVHCTITYADGSKAKLVYLKTTLIDGLPLALLGYRGANPTFPDQSTADQFFDEEQFEAYRELGFIIAEEMLEDGNLQPEIDRVVGGSGNWEPPPVRAAAAPAAGARVPARRRGRPGAPAP